MTYGVNNPREQQKLNEFYHYESAQLTALRAVNADLLALAVAVAEHFADTDAPLGAQARAAIARATGAA